MNELYPNKRYIYCPFEEKDECKFNGGKWDNDKKMWYIPQGIDNEPFKHWFYPYKNKENYIFNLGSGLTPDINPEKVGYFLSQLSSFRS